MRGSFLKSVCIFKNTIFVFSKSCFQEETIRGHQPIWQNLMLCFLIWQQFKSIQASKEVGCQAEHVEVEEFQKLMCYSVELQCSFPICQFFIGKRTECSQPQMTNFKVVFLSNAHLTGILSFLLNCQTVAQSLHILCLGCLFLQKVAEGDLFCKASSSDVVPFTLKYCIAETRKCSSLQKNHTANSLFPGTHKLLCSSPPGICSLALEKMKNFASKKKEKY